MSSSKQQRHSRRQRNTKTVVKLQPRDEQLLLLVSRLGYASTVQLARELFPSLDRARQRLSRLRRAGFMVSSVTDSRETRLWQLTALGKQAVKARCHEDTTDIRLPRAIALGGVQHHLLVGDLRCYLSALHRDDPTTAFEWSNAGGRLHQELGLSRKRLKPDALVAIKRAGRPTDWRLACEADRGTEPIDVIDKKLSVYESLIDAEVVDEIWWVVGQTPSGNGVARTKAIIKRTFEAELELCTRVFTHKHILLRPPIPPPLLLGDQPI